MMNESVQIALIVAIPPTIAAIGAIIIAILNNRKSDAKLDHITILTNSTLTAANKRIETLENAINRLVSEGRISSNLGKEAKR